MLINQRAYDVWLISDTHWGHANCLNFKRTDGSPLRPYTTVEEMNEALVENWNSVVKDGDLVIHAGDVAFSGQVYDEVMPKLKGRKYLVRGNHDLFSEERYRRHFQRIYGVKVFDRYVITHVPVHTDSKARWLGNIHGHLHANTVGDPWYFNISVECINYTPINLDEVGSLLASNNPRLGVIG